MTDFESCTCDECYLHATDLHFDYNDALQHECPIEHYVDCSYIYTIEESVGLYCARVSVPPFTKGRKQLTRLEVDRACEISHVRIHVERVIGQLKKKYTILQGVIPITLLQNRTGTCTIDCIFTVSAALCNMCQSVVSFD